MADCVTKVELHVSCRGLLNKDTLSKSDPMVALFMQDKNNPWYEFGRTDQVQNSLNPDFSKTILVDYYFEMVQKLKFVVYDVDNATKGLDDDDFLGEMECTLGQIVSNRSYTQPLSGHGQSAGTITIYAEEVKGGNEFLRLVFRATNLDNKDFLGKSDPFLEFYKIRSDGSCLVVHRTEVIKDNLNPHWQMLEISLQTLCSGDYDAPIKISCLDWDDNDPDDLIGSVEVTTRQLLSNKDTGVGTNTGEAFASRVVCVDVDIDAELSLKWETGMPLINPKKKQKKKKYVNSGVLYISSCEVAKHHTFLDYVMGGCQINFTVGIDFTASNGDPTSPSSLHYISPTEPNEYIKALMAVGYICQDYDTDKLFPAFGFGATIPPNFQVSHEFALNFNPANPYCQGVPGIVMAYQNCIRQVRLYGPTNVAPIIRHVTTFAAEAAQQQTASSYFVLLLLTDGVLSDMSDTKEAIVRASSLPMSIIIVGVGEADFSDMNQLDADEGRLKSGKNVAERDIVQFVPFREFKSQPPSVLAQQVLAEVPKQVQEYFSRRGLAPMPPKGPAPPSVGRL